MEYDIKPIPNGSFIVRGYDKPGTLDYCGMCLVEPRPPELFGEFEICKWLMKDDAPRDYIPEAIKEIKRIVEPITLTGTFEQRKYKIYQRYLKPYGIEIPIIREIEEEYNGGTWKFYYVEVKNG